MLCVCFAAAIQSSCKNIFTAGFKCRGKRQMWNKIEYNGWRDKKKGIKKRVMFKNVIQEKCVIQARGVEHKAQVRAGKNIKQNRYCTGK